MTFDAYKLIPDTFSRVPSLDRMEPQIQWVSEFDDPDVIGVLVTEDGASSSSSALGMDPDALGRAGFSTKLGSTLVIPAARGPVVVAVGGGKATDLTLPRWREAMAALIGVTSNHQRIAFELPAVTNVAADALGQALAEAALLARYSYSALRSTPENVPLVLLQLLSPGIDLDVAAAGSDVGVTTSRATNIARDLCNAPASHLMATDLEDVAVELGSRFGFAVESFTKEQLIDLGCGGLLGVNAGSVEEPRMLKLTYRPEGEPAGHLGLVGKGIMYDSGGISLKPSDPMHLLMKMDMGGAASVLASFTALHELNVRASVTGFLMCTDNMPSGSAYKLGDVLTARNGTTIEIKNTDAEGRLAMCDALTLAVEEGVDAIVDIATLTGAALMALGQLTAPVFGNDQALVDRVLATEQHTGEQLWQLPLERGYRSQLDSDIADISNLGGKYAGSTTAALFLADFVGDTAWAHIDIAGTMQCDAKAGWRSKGATGFGTQVLIDLARDFTPGV